MRRFYLVFFALAFLASSCIFAPSSGDTDSGQDASADAQSDVENDGISDAENDGASDAEDDGSSDAEVDATGDTEEDTGPTCELPAEECGGTCVDTTSSDEHCGDCDNACANTTDNLTTACVESSCEATEECVDGFVDVDEDLSNGCECEITDPMDPPGDGDDENCDGIDGDRAAALFVKEGATGDGLTAQTPMGSLSQALTDAAADDAVTQILVTSGSYAPISLVSDVTVAGGYSDTFADHDPSSNQTVIEWQADTAGEGDVRTVEATDIDGAALASVYIIAPQAKDLGASTYGVHAQDSTLELRSLTIEGGQAAQGDDGDPAPATDGSCMPYSGGVGGAPEMINPCRETANTTSNNGVDGEPLGSQGTGGAGGPHRCSQLTGVNCTLSDMSGKEGKTGETGTNGTDGQPSIDGFGQLQDGRWEPVEGMPPVAGNKGTGGGGGGAGGNCGTGTDLDDYDAGGAGGDGTRGGCGGAAGENGGAGGASILLLVVDSDLTLEDVSGLAGRGGDGGAGSSGADGEPAQDSADRDGEGAPSAGNGGDGGFGGSGGDGGDGAGGCGGPAYGVAFNSASTITGDLDTGGETFEGGQGGDGVNAAPGGCAGESADMQEL